ncbi:MAG: hypothetical protein F4Z15_09650 [Gammaproteobacteria bacterium]|nr:hypothetical protein [Gammaproteobacteria bacterium]MYD75457.1 hypothetical protein [Gammaproteobacteria bacterium]MYJ52416.1 hypothetical protein [Gammaproteobacteria bacterium]
MKKETDTIHRDSMKLEGILERAISAAGRPEGRIATTEMVELVDARSPKGVGSRLRGLLNTCLMGERIPLEDVLRIRGNGVRRGWEAGPRAERARAQCRATRRLMGDLSALDVTLSQRGAKDTSDRGWMTVRVLREQYFWIRLADGVSALREAIDTMPERSENPTGRGEMFVAEISRLIDGKLETRVPDAFCFGGTWTRGRHDLHGAPTISPDCDEAIQACIVHGQWWERDTRADDIAGVLETLDHFMINWDEWHPAEGLPAQRHVTEIVTEQDGRVWLPPPDLRLCKRLRATFVTGNGKCAEVEIEAIRGQEDLALEQWIESAIEIGPEWARAELLSVSFVGEGRLPHPLESRPLPGHGPHEPVARQLRTGEWSFRGPGRSLLDRAAYCYSEAGNWKRATELLRDLTTVEGWNLAAAEDLATSIGNQGTKLEREGVVRRIADRGLAALERAGFRWNRDRLDWYDHNNRPLLRSYYEVAMMKEQQGQESEALRIYRRIERATRPSDPLGARYEVARLLTLSGKWKELERHCTRLGKDADAETIIARWIAAGMNEMAEATQDRAEEAMNNCPLVVSRVIRGGPSTPEGVQDRYRVGGFDEANRHWNRYRTFYESVAGCRLREQLASRFHAQREGERSLQRWGHRTEEAERNMAHYRRRLMSLASVDATIRNEFWDLMGQIENGSQRSNITAADGIIITRHETGGTIMRIELLGGWEALIEETMPDGTIVMEGTTDFEQLVDEIKANERFRA